jgi:hypothetical protein
VPLYKENHLSDNIQSDRYAKLYQRTMNNFPFNIDDVRSSLSRLMEQC